tara:strand:- start:742 stop:1296 length:555 start_codon:yes stop_codon:yes gene_type:complete
MTFLKDNVLKLILNRLGHDKRVPKDIIISIFKIIIQEKQKELDEVISYHTKALYKLTTCSEDPVTPENRGLEWAIKNYSSCGLNTTGELRNRCYTPFIRFYTVVQINVYSSPYLVDMDGNMLNDHQNKNDRQIVRDHNLKVMYLNKSPRDEVIEDYYEYLKSCVSPEYPIQKLMIDQYGEAYYM